jgi:hypothetical protein
MYERFNSSSLEQLSFAIKRPIDDCCLGKLQTLYREKHTEETHTLWLQNAEILC